MEVGLFPNLRRPGIGLRPHRKGQRPLLPQHARHVPCSKPEAPLGFLVLLMASMFIVANDLGTPAGAVTLRGAWNFQTPPGWDTVYTPIFNMIERPVAPMLVIRVETDWFVHDTEFRYVLQPGEAISASYNMPIGQCHGEAS
jgi:hypothetical protein